jgi:hypothetical protein
MTTIDTGLREMTFEAARIASLTGVNAVAAWTAYADDVRRVVNRVRALQVADLIYLEGLKLREVADQVSAINQVPFSFQNVADLLKRHGPTEYATIARTGGTYEVSWVPVLGSRQTRRELMAMRDLGRRVVPARWEITREGEIDGERLWDRIGE